MSSNQYLFLFTIGPVQSFIAQARKTRDLYAGSAILGEIIEAVIDEVKKRYPGRKAEDIIIFPYPELGAKPNRVIMSINFDDDKKARDFGQNLERVAREKWIELAIDSLRQAGVCSIGERIKVERFDGRFYRELLENHDSKLDLPLGYRQQICDFLEVYWVGIKRTNSYEADYNKIQKLLAAIKNTRRFNQIHEPAARKCSLDGERNALFYLPSAQNGKPPQFIQKEAKEIQKNHYLMTPGEGLSAVSLVKRFYKQEQGFPSTAKIALWNVLEKIDAHKQEGYKNQFGQYFDEQLYYEENLTKQYFKKHEFRGLIDRLPAIREERKALLDGYKQSRYYAFIAFDGDDMGKVWSGEFLKDKVGLEEFQKSLAKHLGEFAKEAEEIVDVHKGKTVYAGGDDFLGFVNLNSLFKVMKDISEKYDTVISDRLQDMLLPGNKLSFSAGVAIAHYKEPLSIVLHEALAAEAEAKDVFEKYGKNAFAISVLKHSGESRKCLFKWRVGSKYLAECKDEIVTLLNEDKGFSNTFIKNIDKEFTPLFGDVDDYRISDLFEVELERLIVRSSKKTDDKVALEKMKGLVKSIYDSNYEYNQPFENIFSALHVCDFIKRNTVDE